jgi:hypothetical protein
MYRLVLAIFLGSLASTAWAQSDAVATAVYSYLESRGDSNHPDLRVFYSDLNDDGRSDAIVLLTSDDWCGSSGCNMLIFQGTDKGFSFVSSSAVTQEPVSVLPEKQHGWHTLVVMTGRVGRVLMRFNGHKYPSNPSLQSKVPAALTQEAQVLSKQIVTK